MAANDTIVWQKNAANTAWQRVTIPASASSVLGLDATETANDFPVAGGLQLDGLGNISLAGAPRALYNLADAAGALINDGAGHLSWGSVLPSLPSAQIFVGNVSNVATAVAMSQDAAISNTGAVTVGGLKGVSVPALATGYLNYNSGTGLFSWAAGSSATGANPTASVGLSAVNGSATTFLRSDGAPALSQAIAPTWSGQHIFSNSKNGFGTLASPAAQVHINDGNAPVIALLGSGAGFAFSGQGAQWSAHQIVASSGSASDSPVWWGKRARGTLATPTTVASGDTVFSFIAGGFDGVSVNNSAELRFAIDGTVSTNAVPEAVLFFTGSAGGSRTETARFTSGQNLLIGTTSSTGLTGAGGLIVGSTTASSSTSTGAALVAGGLGVAGAIYCNTLSAASLICSGTTLTLSNAAPVLAFAGSGVLNIQTTASNSYSWINFLPNGTSQTTGMAFLSANSASTVAPAFLLGAGGYFTGMVASAWNIGSVVDNSGTSGSSWPLVFVMGSTGGRIEACRLSTAANWLVGTTSDTGLTGAGGLSVGSTTASTTYGTGCAIFAGGVGISGNIVTNGSIKTAAPAGGVAAAWKTGAVRSGVALVASTTAGIQIDVGGVLYTLAILTTNP
jgi:hypothetical protein